MSCTTSPGRSRGSVNTISDAIRSDGIATRRRWATYFFTRIRPRALLVQPRAHEAPAVVVADVGPEILDIGHPRRYRAHRSAEGVVDLLRGVALDVEHQVAALLLVEGAPLLLDHVGELGVVHA